MFNPSSQALANFMLDSVIGSHLAMIAGVAMTLLIVPRMLRQRRSAASMTAWLMAILLIPWLGIPAYLVLGGRKLDTALMLKPQLGSGQPTATLPPGEAGADQLLQSYGLPRAQPGNRFSLCADGVEIYQKLSKSSRARRSRIHMASFILNPDPVGRAIIEALAQRARHGLEVRLLLDGFGSFHTSKRALDPADPGRRRNRLLPARELRHFTRTNMRNHRKMLIADDRQRRRRRRQCRAANIWGPSPTRGAGATCPFCLRGRPCATTQPFSRPTGQFVTGHRIEPLAGAPRHPPAQAVVQVAPSGPDVPGDPVYAAIVSAVFAARRRLWIVTPYFIPPEGLARGARACRPPRRRRQRLCAGPVQSLSSPTSPAASRFATRRRPASASSASSAAWCMRKIVLVDDALAMVGSVNIDPRSLFLNFEANAIVYGAE